jgi:hypothetical protein
VADSFGLDARGVESVADDVEETSGKFRAVMQAFEEAAAGLVNADNPGQPIWGNDKQGKQFADGADGYVARTNGVKVAVDAKVALLLHYVEVLRQTAASAQAQDGS